MTTDLDQIHQIDMRRRQLRHTFELEYKGEKDLMLDAACHFAAVIEARYATLEAKVREKAHTSPSEAL